MAPKKTKARQTLIYLLGIGLLTAGLATGCRLQSPDHSAASTEQPPEANNTQRWVSVWGTATYTTFPNGPLTQDGFTPNTAAFEDNQANNQSFRMMIYPSLGGNKIRLRFENSYGEQAISINNVSIAKRAADTGPAIDGSTLAPVTFNGETSVTIAAGEIALSDGTEFVYSYGDHLAINFHIPNQSGPMSWHAEAFATQYISAVNSGDVSQDETGAALSNGDRGWFFLSGMDAEFELESDTAAEPLGIAIFGDSITDGFVSTPERNERYPDFLARRLQTANIQAGVINLGINSNTVNNERDPITTGDHGTLRFNRDVISRTDIRSVMILLGTNDLSNGASAETAYAGLVDLAEQAHAAGICTLVSTILPRNDPPQPFGWDAATEEPQRRKLNDMILNSDVFDAVADIGKAMENPAIEHQPNQPFFVEGLHPNSVGMEALANAIPLEPLLPPPLGSCNR